MKLYEIEEKHETENNYNYVEYRFLSLYNGMRGTWLASVEQAKEQGEKHQAIIEMIHNAHPMMIVSSGAVR
jgi:hypothetical protein